MIDALETLQLIREYLDQRADAQYIDGRPVPNGRSIRA